MRISDWSSDVCSSDLFLLRAAVAMDQIYVLDKGEALYPVAHLDAQGRQLDGRNNYALCFRKQDLPPVDGFWSITLYYEKGFLAANPIDRYSIGDRTPGLAYGPDGSLRPIGSASLRERVFQYGEIAVVS